MSSLEEEIPLKNKSFTTTDINADKLASGFSEKTDGEPDRVNKKGFLQRHRVTKWMVFKTFAIYAAYLGAVSLKNLEVLGGILAPINCFGRA